MLSLLSYIMNSCFKELFIFEKFIWFIVAIALLITNWVTVFHVFHCCRHLHHWSNVIEATKFGDSKFMFHLTKSRIIKEICMTDVEHLGRNNSIFYWHWPVRIAHQVGHHTGNSHSLISERLHQFIKRKLPVLEAFNILTTWESRKRAVEGYTNSGRVASM